MNDMTPAIIPKSDQISADDLIGGPRTIRIASVDIRPGTEQPISVHYEGENGRPYKPCKSMARVMVYVWGPDASQYVGRSLTLYRDPEVKWGGMAVGGIRISHMSHMPRESVMSLTVTKGSRKPYKVSPLVVDAEQSRPEKLIAWVRGQIGKCSEASDVFAIMAKVEANSAWEECSVDERAIITGMRDARLAQITPTDTAEAEADEVA